MSIYFYYFPITCISPFGRAWPFIWTNLNPLHPGILCAKFDWNWPSGSGEENENVKSLQTDRQTDGQTDRQTTDDRWSEKLTWAFSSGELKMKHTFWPLIVALSRNVLRVFCMGSASDYMTFSWSPGYFNQITLHKQH